MQRLLCTAIAAAALAFGAGQASAAQLVVNDDAAGNVAEPAPCDAAPDHTTIQAAITAASAGDSIAVCPGTYTEDLKVDKDDLSIAAVDRADKSTTVIQGVAVATGTPAFPNCGAAAEAPGTALANINVIANGVTIAGFTIQSPAVVNAGEYTCGMILDGKNNTIYQNAFKVSCGDPGSPAIQTWANANGPIGSVDGLSIEYNSFSSSNLDTLDSCLGYEAIFINPQTNPVSSNPVRIIRNTFSGKMYRGVGVYDRSWTDVSQNRMKTTLKVVDTGPDAFGAVPVGIKIWEGSNSVVLGNRINSRDRHRHGRHNRNGLGQFSTGIWLNSGTSGNVVTRNVVKGSDVYDCLDESADSGTAGTANLWTGNIGRKASPAGICVAAASNRDDDRDRDDDDRDHHDNDHHDNDHHDNDHHDNNHHGNNHHDDDHHGDNHRR